jgi:NADPH:quinone reductase-like Zn-dependent oxidoreductase
MTKSPALPKTMRAITISRYGGPEVLEHREDAPVPNPGPGEILVEVAYAGVNFMDVHTRQGKYASSRTYPVRLPCTLGMEGAGTVVAIGPGIDRLAIGDRVAWCIAWGSYAQYACIPAFRAARIPDAIGFDVAAASIFQGCTAHYLVNDVALLGPDSTCLVHAASGSIGQILIQMAKRRGAKVFATASSDEKREIALARGADAAFAYEDFAGRVRAATDGVGVHVVFDSLGKASLRESFRAARVSGLIVNYGNVSGSVTDLDPIELGEAGSLFLTRPRLADHMRDAATVQRRADDVFDALLKGELRIDVAERHTLDDVHEAHERIESRRQVGKPVMRVR